jgi:UDP-2,3-diacylglucosamine pyrophosphatase LpxH
MRALVISDTHFGAWTGEDLLREQENLDLLEPHLDVDEVIVLGDMFDFLFGSMRDAFEAANGLLSLLREKLQGKRLVFLAGNHDHHLVSSEGEASLELQLAGPQRLGKREGLELDPAYRLFEQRLEGVEVDFRYPTYTFGGVFCTHGHYLDVHAQRSGSGLDRLLGQAIWTIAVGSEHSPTLDDYEATSTLLTELLFTIAQVPNGTNTERRVYKSFEVLGRAVRRATAPRRALEAVARSASERLGAVSSSIDRRSAERQADTYQGAQSREAERRRRTGAPAGGEASSFVFARRIHPSDPTEAAVAAFDQVVTNLGWAEHTNTIVFAHTHQPLDGVPGPSGKCRYWNTGSWIYEPDLTSQRAYASYLHNAWPGTAVLIDTDQDQPQLLRLREHLNPLNTMDGGRGERSSDRSAS